MQTGDEAVDDGVQILVGHSRQLDQSHAAVGWPVVGDVVAAAVDRHVVAALDQPAAEFLDARLKSAVTGGHAARA